MGAEVGQNTYEYRMASTLATFDVDAASEDPCGGERKRIELNTQTLEK